ncbi:glycoside hydrolase family 16 protein, partial [Pleurotus ostreatus PC15]|uniref:Uncharacterized protein n=2 Tax=Pleurotus TaxID=5320 RepID=A0ACB7IY33_PLECO
MHITSLPLYLLLLIAQASLTLAGPRAVLERAHRFALRRSHGLASDLRLAFGAVPPQKRQGRVLMKRGIYCIAGPGNSGLSHGPTSSGTGSTGDSGGNVGNGNSTSVSSGNPRGSSTRPASTARPTNVAPSPWKLAESHEGSDFFRGWDFFTSADPTNGIVDYINEADGRSAGILSVNNNGNAVMRVETTPTVAANRKSIRITTQSTWNGGLFIMDAVHMPTGCGTWPAFWSNGPDWPRGGEIDIVEGVHDYTNNQATLHTSPGCRLPSSDTSNLKISGSLIAGQDCAAASTNNEGCGIRAPNSNSFGAGFNSNGGGVYVMQWDSDGVAIFFFPRGSVPADITAGAPQPTLWGLPQARFPASGCNPSQFFNNHHLIFDTTLCGDWAGGVWNAAGIPGQEQSCAQRTGFSTCEAFVRANGASFSQAFWEVQSVKIYQRQN